MIFGIILIPLDFLLSKEAEAVMFTRSFGIELGVFLLLILQFGSKVILLFTDPNGSSDSSGTLDSSSISGASSMSAIVTSGSQAPRRKSDFNKGNYEVTPDILSLEPIVMATISEADKFFDESVARVNKLLKKKKGNASSESYSSLNACSSSTSTRVNRGGPIKPLNISVSSSIAKKTPQKSLQHSSSLSHESFSGKPVAKVVVKPNLGSSLSSKVVVPVKPTTPKILNPPPIIKVTESSLESENESKLD